jgi:hypothetical protein
MDPQGNELVAQCLDAGNAKMLVEVVQKDGQGLGGHIVEVIDTRLFSPDAAGNV